MAKPSKPPRVQAIRMYLLKKSIKKYADALRDDITVTPYLLAPDLGATGQAYVRQPIQKELTWVRFLESGLSKKLPKLVSTAHAAVVFLEVDDRIVAMVFGMGRYMLKDTSYEADFGIVAALNSVDPNGLRSADTFQFESVAVHKRTQTSKTTTLADFEIDTTREHVRSLTGKAKNKLLAERVTGNEGAFGANVRITFKELVEMGRKVGKAYESKDYKKAFPRFDNLKRVADKQKIADLEAKLIEKLRDEDTDGIHISPPEPLDYDDFSGFSLTEKGDILDELTVEAYLESRDDLSKLDMDALKRHRIFLRKETADVPLGRWSVFKSLICEFPEGKDVFVLMNGEWYRIAKTFSQQVRNAIKKIAEVDVGLPPLGNCKTETEYLAAVGKAGGGLIVMDQKRAYCEDAGHYIEVCDVLTPKREFVHIKRKDGGSSDLSHLFFQGKNSAIALLRDEQYREQARKHLAGYGTTAVKRIPKDKPKAGSITVVYGIMGKIKGSVAESLPFFSQLSLMDAAKELAERGIEVRVCPISS